MIPPTLLPPLPTTAARQAGVQPAAVVAPWSHIPPAPFFRAVWCDLLRVQLTTNLSTWPVAHLWFANLAEPAVYTGGHWSPLVLQPHVATPLLLLSTPDTFDQQPVERLHQVIVPRMLHPRLLGQSFGVALVGADVRLHRQDRQIALQINQQTLIAAQMDRTMPSADLHHGSAHNPVAVPQAWLTMNRHTPRLLRLTTNADADHAHEFNALPLTDVGLQTLTGLHPLFKNARVTAVHQLTQPLTATLHRPVCIAGAGCLRAWGTVH